MAAKYAQHFLINRHAAERIVNSLAISPEDAVLEIGPGKGALTAYLLRAQTVAVVEIDSEMVELLKNRFGSNSKIHIFHADVLDFDFKQLPKLTGNKSIFKVVGNLPYNLTSSILRKLSEWDGWREAFVMVQKEVAERICAKVATPEYGALTVGMSLTCKAEFVFELAATSFKPAPRVKSAVVKLIRRDQFLTDNVPATQKVIQAAFQQRRKTILNSLSHGLGLEKEKVQSVLAELGIAETIRPERIPVEKFVELSSLIY